MEKSEIPTGTIEKLERQRHHSEVDWEHKSKTLDEEYGIELQPATVALARQELFVDFCMASGILTEEQVLQFQVMELQQVNTALDNALKIGYERKEQMEKAQAAQQLGVNPRGPQLLGPSGMPIARGQ